VVEWIVGVVVVVEKRCPWVPSLSFFFVVALDDLGAICGEFCERL